eukprot:s123_g7.t1
MADDSDDDLVSYRMRPQKPIDPTLMATTCAGIVVLLTGLGFLFGAIANTRVEHVSDYSQEVHEWEKYRPLLKDTQISMSFNLPETAHQPGGLVESQLMQKEEEDWAFHDTEEMKGVEQYQPLKHVTDLELPCLYSNCSMVALNAADSLQPREDWNDQVLPSWADAPRASFQFVTRGLTGGKQSSFSSPAIPLIFDLPTVGQTPQPRMYCYGPGHGVFRRPGTCHHAQRLKELCVVLEPDGDGGWKLRNAVVTQFFYNNSRRSQDLLPGLLYLRKWVRVLLPKPKEPSLSTSRLLPRKPSRGEGSQAVQPPEKSLALHPPEALEISDRGIQRRTQRLALREREGDVESRPNLLERREHPRVIVSQDPAEEGDLIRGLKKGIEDIELPRKEGRLKEESSLKLSKRRKSQKKRRGRLRNQPNPAPEQRGEREPESRL